ncbi:MAG: hypothetical protein ABI580_04985 [Burkholderiaceae bacterium]
MINSSPEAMAAVERALPSGATAALLLAAFFAVLAVTTPAQASIESVAAPVSEPLVDKHDFINPQKSAEATDGARELERLFWMCDYAATAGTLEANEVEMCGAATEALQRIKLDGDSEKLLAWWRLNKETEHQALLGAEVTGHCAQGDVK